MGTGSEFWDEVQREYDRQVAELKVEKCRSSEGEGSMMDLEEAYKMATAGETRMGAKSLWTLRAILGAALEATANAGLSATHERAVADHIEAACRIIGPGHDTLLSEAMARHGALK